MKLPWVSRAAYEEMEGRLRLELGAERVSHTHLESRYDRLFDAYNDLRKQGFTAPPVAQPAQPLTPDALIGRTIDSIPASRDPKNRARMWEQVIADRSAGKSDEEILMRIRRGNRPAEEMA